MNLFQSIIHWENVMMISKEQSTVILSNVLNYVVKKTEYDESVQKVNTTELDKILKKNIKDVDKKIPDTSKSIVTKENALDLGDKNREKTVNMSFKLF